MFKIQTESKGFTDPKCHYSLNITTLNCFPLYTPQDTSHGTSVPHLHFRTSINLVFLNFIMCEIVKAYIKCPPLKEL